MKCDKCGQEIEEKTIKIYSRYDSKKVIFEYKGYSLRYADLRNANLRYADLRNANLRNADLSGADLRNANLSYADLRNANLRNADLSGTDLRNAKSEGIIINLKSYKKEQLKQLIEQLN